MRIEFFRKITGFLLLVVILALGYMQLVKGGYYFDQSVNNRIRLIPIDGPRGKIFDRNGEVLAENKLSYNVGVVPQDIEDKDATFVFLGKILNRDPKNLIKEYTRKKITPFDSVILSQDVSRQVLIAVEENRLLYPGLIVEPAYERYYPYGASGGHALGYVGKIELSQAQTFEDYGYTPLSIVGKMGVEKTYDGLLRATPGGRQIEINSRGQEVRVLGFKESLPGKNIILSVDERVQVFAQQLLGDQRGSIVVMDLKDGAILSLVSSPAFNPNYFTDKSQQGAISGYMTNRMSPLLNRAVSGQFPPGSVFKIPVALAALQTDKIKTSFTIDCPGFLMLGNARFGCAHVHGSENIFQAIARSCNVFFFKVGLMVSPKTIGRYAKAFGFGRPTGIDLPFENKGQVIDDSSRGHRWFSGDTLNLSIGQGETLATPIQLTVLMGAMATEGILFKPHVVRAIDGVDLPAVHLERLPLVRLKENVWHVVEQGMRMTVTDPEGTANILNDIPNMVISGKTGTAQAGLQGNHAWFAGYVTSNKGRYAFCVFLEHGGSSANTVLLTKELLLYMQQIQLI